jgi:hypothetical protein
MQARLTVGGWRGGGLSDAIGVDLSAPSESAWRRQIAHMYAIASQSSLQLMLDHSASIISTVNGVRAIGVVRNSLRLLCSGFHNSPLLSAQAMAEVETAREGFLEPPVAPMCERAEKVPRYFSHLPS